MGWGIFLVALHTMEKWLWRADYRHIHHCCDRDFQDVLKLPIGTGDERG
jgi:hypothetical protein